MLRTYKTKRGTNVVVFLSIPILFIICALSSCKVTRSASYFETLPKDTILRNFIPNNYEAKIKAGDILAITISSLNAGEDAFFNAAGAVTTNGGGYLVKEQGTILMHKLGDVNVAGLTRRELSAKLEKDLQPYLKDAIVNIQFLNHKVTIFGEVGTANVVNMPEEQLPLIDVLVKSGGITQNGKIDRVMIIRDMGTEKQVKYVSLRDNSLFNSPWYYVQPNDIVYVRPDVETQVKTDKRENLQRNIGFITAGASFLFLIIDRLTR